MDYLDSLKTTLLYLVRAMHCQWQWIDLIPGGKGKDFTSWMWGPSSWTICCPLEKGVRTFKFSDTERKLHLKCMVYFVWSILLLPFPWSWLCHGWQPSQEEDISYFWENSDLTEIIYLPQEMAPYSWTQQSWNNKFSRFDKVGIIFIQSPRKCNSKFKMKTV